MDSAPTLLQVFTNIPIVRSITEELVRITFFNQFVGGDTALGTIPLLRTLRSSNMGALFAYSIEVDEREATAHSTKKKPTEPIHKRIVNEMIRSIDVAADFEDELLQGAPAGRRTWVAVKMTALLPDAQSLINFSKYLIDTRSPLPVPFPGCPRSTDLDVLHDPQRSGGSCGPLSEDDVVALRELYQDLRRICARAQQRGVKIILDAEYSWYQPAIDALQLSLMREFNTTSASQDLSIPNVQPLIYGTFQAYLRRTPSYLDEAIKDARANGYSLGVKLVRGAYHPHEVAALEDRKKGKGSLSITPESQPPVWHMKDETDSCYDACVKKLIETIKDDLQSHQQQQPMIGALFGTHNWTSSRLILSELVRSGIAKEEKVEGEKEGIVVVGNEVTERVTLGQLYGMNNALSDYLVRRTRSSAPMVIKYVPYGALSEVMPYLSRRAIENKSILGNGAAREECKRARKAIFGKLFG
ncbi:FAD-linked oxidoreductase [Marasmius fiardii PR-910]|nr:FAD-linked oxidoreductase [Marasmius fiardii PR-910]